MSKIAILDDYQNVSQKFADWGSLKATHEIQVFNQHIDNVDALVKTLAEFDIICAMRERTPFPEKLLQQLPKLRLLITSGAKNAAIDMLAARELGIIVCGTDSPGHAASELAFALILALARNITQEDQAMRSGQWQTTLGADLYGQTLGILGLGRHGANLARFGQAFNMNVIAWSQNLTAEHCQELGVNYVDKQTLFTTADFISIHLKMGQRNKGLVDTQALSWMQPTAYLVNTSRGPIVDEPALLAALNTHQIAGAGLDVYDQEPLPEDHPLRSTPNTVLTSHVGYVTRQTYEVFYGQTVECIQQYLKHDPIHVLN